MPALILLIVWLGLSLLVARLAVSYKRSGAAWFILAVLFSPLTALVFLVVADVPHAAVVLEEKEERLRRGHADRTDIRDLALSEMQCPKCGARVNPETGDGLHSPEGEPWLFLCNQCQAEIEPAV